MNARGSGSAGARRYGIGALVAVLVVGGCGKQGVDWSAPENFVLSESSARKDEGVALEYESLVDAPPDGVYQALADVEHYPDFIPGVDQVQLLETKGDTKTVFIAQRVIGRQSSAKVVWTLDPGKRRVSFTTVQSNLSYNDGSYEIEGSPSGTRSLVRSHFLVREADQTPVPIGVLATATREAFLAAAKGVRDRAVKVASTH